MYSLSYVRLTPKLSLTPPRLYTHYSMLSSCEQLKPWRTNMVSIWQLCQPLQQRATPVLFKNWLELHEEKLWSSQRIWRQNRAKYSAIHVKIFQTTLQGVFCGKTVTQNVVFKEVLWFVIFVIFLCNFCHYIPLFIFLCLSLCPYISFKVHRTVSDFIGL